MIHKTPSINAPMTVEEVALAHGAWQAFQAYVASLPREPDMISLLETFSQVVGRCFDTRAVANQAFNMAEARYFGDNKVKPFRRGVSPQSAKAPTQKEDLIAKLGVTEEQMDAFLEQFTLLSPPKGGPEES